MILIIGGRSQGKREFAAKVLDISTSDIANGNEISPETALECRYIADFQELVKKCPDPVGFAGEICRKKPDCVIMDEVGCGIVPMEKNERIWRENVGRCGCIIASAAECVVRITCGIPSIIKGELQ